MTEQPTAHRPPPAVIVGTGALASLFAARLSHGGVAVTMLGTWPEGITALRSRGVELVSRDGGTQTFPVRATTNPAECANTRLALVLVKSWQTRRAARQLAACLAPDGLALTLQNGLGNREVLAAQLGDDRVLAGVTTTGATLLGPGCVRPGGEGAITLGRHPDVGQFLVLLERAGFTVTLAEDLEALLWGKLVINAAINPLTALLGVPNGELLTCPTARQLMAELVHEVAAVSAALGIHLPYSDPLAAAEDVARRTASNRSSMLQDIARGAPTEIDAICGAVTRYGKQAGIPTPVNRVMTLLVKSLTATPSPPQTNPTN